MIYLLTAIGLTPGGSSTVHISRQNNTQNNTIDTNNTLNNTIHWLGKVRTVPRLCEVYPGICLTTEEKAWKNLSQGSRRMPVGKEYTNVCDYIIMSLSSPPSLSRLVTEYIVDSATGGQSDFRFPADATFPSPKRPYRLWNPPTLPFGGYRDVNVTTSLHLMPRLRMSGATPLLPYRPSWRGQGLYLFY